MRKGCVTQRKPFYSQLAAPVTVPNAAVSTTQQNIENRFSTHFFYFNPFRKLRRKMRTAMCRSMTGVSKQGLEPS